MEGERGEEGERRRERINDKQRGLYIESIRAENQSGLTQNEMWEISQKKSGVYPNEKHEIFLIY